MHAVLIIDRFDPRDPDGQYLVKGFPTKELAMTFAKQRVWDSVEGLRKEGQSVDELKDRWFRHGEDAQLEDGSYSGSQDLDMFVATPATAGDRDWQKTKALAGLK